MPEYGTEKERKAPRSRESHDANGGKKVLIFVSFLANNIQMRFIAWSGWMRVLRTMKNEGEQKEVN